MSGAIFVLAASAAREPGPVAALLSTAGWASAARRRLGAAWIVTSSGTIGPDEARRAGAGPHMGSSSRRPLVRRVPTVAKTAVKDLLRWRRIRRLSIEPDGPWRDTEVAFVWQRHELFHTAGIRLARDLGVPSVLFVTAPQVWEARRWGVRRPGWGGLLERRGDVPPLRAADLVACGTDTVAEAVVSLGIDEDRILVTPTGVDLDLFDGDGAGAGRRGELGLDGRFVVGWTGSFRKFHDVGLAVEAVATVERAALLLVGDGPERAAVEQMAVDLGVPVVSTGTVAQRDLPGYLAAMDVAVITASTERPFHYSPLKLAEYLASGRPVVAPCIGQIAERLTDGVDAALYPPGDAAELGATLRRLRDDPAERARLGTSARATAEAEWSWDHQVDRILAALADRNRLAVE